MTDFNSMLSFEIDGRLFYYGYIDTLYRHAMIYKGEELNVSEAAYNLIRKGLDNYEQLKFKQTQREFQNFVDTSAEAIFKEKFQSLYESAYKDIHAALQYASNELETIRDSRVKVEGITRKLSDFHAKLDTNTISKTLDAKYEEIDYRIRKFVRQTEKIQKASLEAVQSLQDFLKLPEP